MEVMVSHDYQEIVVFLAKFKLPYQPMLLEVMMLLRKRTELNNKQREDGLHSPAKKEKGWVREGDIIMT